MHEVFMGSSVTEGNDKRSSPMHCLLWGGGEKHNNSHHCSLVVPLPCHPTLLHASRLLWGAEIKMLDSHLAGEYLDQWARESLPDKFFWSHEACFPFCMAVQLQPERWGVLPITAYDIACWPAHSLGRQKM